MDTPFAAVFVPLALAVIMFGLGLSMSVDDFRRVRRHPRAVVVALFCQSLLLPAACFGLVIALDLSPVLAVGMMLLAASPGGTTANLYSHLFGGDVALNVTLTALNAVLAIVTMPIVANLSLHYFDPDIGQDGVGLQFDKVVPVLVVVLIPVVIGLLVRRRSPAWAERMDTPVRRLSILALVGIVVGTAVSEWSDMGSHLADAGPATLIFCALSLAVGYLVPRMVGVDKRQAIATSMEIGVHNSAVAMTIAIAVLGDVSLAVPAAVYGVLCCPTAAVAGLLITRFGKPAPVEAPAHTP
ncbi:bile acid:sodium symporter family protein [Streptomyces sp. P38-E01]|uniref:Bile acid:sodium symporter family protein n=1 Tax=Streptomyces tardus TaxID=2780544 RepID=A0A949JG74_9ACTN|nr:bile acid:sodium symporter family protein [Streptomyces tardus]MBU7598348.1 bile acid:sodium symporter family protein [Streptomyces tardus]